MVSQLGVYICSGCGIGDAVDTAKLAAFAERELKPASCHVHPFLCGREGVGLIKGDLASGAVEAAVIAACTARVKTREFDFDHKAVSERVNLREQVAWCQKPGDEETQAMAEDYLRMGCVKARKTEPMEPLVEEISRKVLVVGGGISGLTAALAGAEAGYEVVLVEKQARLGGFMGTVKKSLPHRPPYTEPVAASLADIILAVSKHPRIEVFTSALIGKLEGQPGMFDVSIVMDGREATTRVGAVILATGWKPYNASRLTRLGYGVSPDVITGVELERMAAAGPIVRPSNGQGPKSVLFVQCAGSRDKEHLAYCSSVCCLATLKHVSYIREQNPDTKVYVVYKDMRTPGLYEQFTDAAQAHPLNFFTFGEVAGVEKGNGDRLAVTVRGSVLGEPIRVEADLVVLATGMVPNAADGEAIRALKDAEVKSVNAESENQRAEAARTVETLKEHRGTQILNLTYRQGPDLPVLSQGFPDSHFVCFPYETRRTGIYAAGAVRAPMDSAQAEQDAWGAMMKAIQSVEMAAHGQAVHPRAGDLSYPIFQLQRCTQCKRCTEECPFGSLDEDEKGTPKLNVNRCRRCGICMGACPERIVSFKNYSVDLVASMIKAIEVPEEDEEKPRVLVLACENDAYPALDAAGQRRLQYDASVRIIPVRCLGSVNIVWIADALSRGIDGILLLGCKMGEDYQCHFVKGSELAKKRLENVSETLQRLQLEPERLQLAEVSINEWGSAPALLNSFVEKMREIGPNPYKGF